MFSVHQPVEEELNVTLYDVVTLDVRVSLYFPLSVVLATLPTLVSANSILTFDLCAVHVVVTLAKLTPWSRTIIQLMILTYLCSKHYLPL